MPGQPVELHSPWRTPAPRYVYPDVIGAPDGRTVTMDEYGNARFIGSEFDYVANILVPISQEYADWVMPGTYTLSYAWSGNSSAELCHALLVETADPASTQTLNLRVYVGGAAGRTAESARTDRRIALILERVGEILASANIRLGNVEFVDLSAGASERYQYIRSYRQVQDLCEESILPPGGLDEQLVLNVMLVDAFVGAMDGVLGVSAGIVGGAGTHGTSSSCATFSTAGIVDDAGATYIGQVMAHEIGHFLGLFHTTETDLTKSDPLADTPSCQGLGVWEWDECPDFTNLMFPLAVPGSPSRLSREQILVLRANPLTRP